MNYNVELIKKENYKPTFWSGGMATELITYPQNSDYTSRNFLWRLGVAKIDILESTFSTLPQVLRKFMVIEGQIMLDHENKYKKSLTCFEQDNFMGDWNTKTYGKASVFNLMTRENYQGELIHINIPPRKLINFEYDTELNKDLIAICFYVTDGTFKTTLNNKEFKVNSKDLLKVDYLKSSFSHEFVLNNDSSNIANIVASVIYRS